MLLLFVHAGQLVNGSTVLRGNTKGGAKLTTGHGASHPPTQGTAGTPAARLVSLPTL